MESIEKEEQKDIFEYYDPKYSTYYSFVHDVAIPTGKKARENQIIEKKRKLEEELEKKGRVNVDKSFAKTLVCDGAILGCPNAYFKYDMDISSNVYEGAYRYPGIPSPKIQTTEMIKFLVPRLHIFLMGLDPVGTSMDILSDNFKIASNLHL